MLGGLTQDEYQFLVDEIKTPLEKAGARLWLFGSRARGDHKPFSDVDLLVEGRLLDGSLIGKLQETAENSNFPYKIDLVLDDELADAYRSNVEVDKVLFN